MLFQRERPYPMVPTPLALRWYMDSPHTHLVVMGARVLDWESWTSYQISDEEYLRRSTMSADAVRAERDGHQVKEMR